MKVILKVCNGKQTKEHYLKVKGGCGRHCHWKIRIKLTMSADIESEDSDSFRVYDVVEAIETGQMPLAKQTPSDEVTFAEKDETTTFNTFDGEASQADDGGGSPDAANNKFSLNIANKVGKADKENCYVGPILSISPAEELVFIPSDPNREALEVLSLANTSPKHVAYKVKTTSPEKYRVRPSTGCIKPGDSVSVNVYLQPGNADSLVVRDKFLIMYTNVERSLSNSQVTEHIRNSAKDNITEHRLKCRLTSPKAKGADQADGAGLQEQLTKLTAQMEALTSTQRSMHDQLHKMYFIQVIMMVVIIFLIVSVVLSYTFDVFPINKYTVNACTPFFHH